MDLVRSITIPNTYKDSVFLMKVSGKAKDCEGVTMASAMMATQRNKDLMRASGLGTEGLDAAQADDLVVSVSGGTEAAVNKALELVQGWLNESLVSEKNDDRTQEKPVRLEQLLTHEKYNFALISVAGDYAGYEAAKAISAEMNVMIYSDNISKPVERKLKQMADERGLLVMGPDCGTAIIQGVPMGFANQVRRGSIGVVGASGTGIQEVTCLIDALGGGISQAIGTGGRDLQEEIGGLTCLAALRLLAESADTQVVVLISKPPSPSVRARVCECIGQLRKRIVVHYVGCEDYTPERKAGAVPAATLEAAAMRAVEIDKGEKPGEANQMDVDAYTALLEKTFKRSANITGDGYLRAIYGGGTLCYESLVTVKRGLPGGLVQSNLHFTEVYPLAGDSPAAHAFWDMGDDEFTVGRPHPMIDPELKNSRIEAAVADPAVSVVLFDNVLGFGSHEDPAGTAARAVIAGRNRRNNDVFVIASVCGTDSDRPSRRDQLEKLTAAGVTVLPSNAQAARFALDLLKRMKGMKVQ
jgi:FdrA protein